MNKLLRLYYCWIRNIQIARNVLFDGDLSYVSNSKVHFGSHAKVSIGKNVQVSNSKIEVIGGELIIEAGVIIRDYHISISKGCKLFIGKNCVLEKWDNWRTPYVILWDKSSLEIGNNNRLRCDIMCRFGGQCKIGEYNCVNERTELRCDENITIGSYNMISYNCRIWDTNTHTLYNDDTRRQLTRKMYPNIGAEVDKPVTRPILIGDDCLLGEECAVLKGSVIGNKCIVGVRSVLAGKTILEGAIAVGNPFIEKKI